MASTTVDYVVRVLVQRADILLKVSDGAAREAKCIVEVRRRKGLWRLSHDELIFPRTLVSSSVMTSTDTARNKQLFRK